MSPITHLLASWIVAAKTTDNPRDCRLVALAGVTPDLDGLGIVIDIIRNELNQTETFDCYQIYHHYLLHGIAGAVFVAVLLAAFARHRWRVFVFALFAFHLHLLCDFLGSRGPEPGDWWPIYYFGPFSNHPMWLWRGQWRLDGWQNQLITVVLLAWSFRLAVTQGASFVGLFNRRWDATFVGTLRKWQAALSSKWRSPGA